jgi:ribosomal-protein-alanine N-acetyltransferase
MLIVALREAIRQGATLATLEVRASNLTAQNLYRSFQFQTVGERHHYYLDNNEDALIMSIQHLGKEYLEWLNQPERMRKTLSDGGA